MTANHGDDVAETSARHHRLAKRFGEVARLLQYRHDEAERGDQEGDGNE